MAPGKPDNSALSRREQLELWKKKKQQTKVTSTSKVNGNNKKALAVRPKTNESQASVDENAKSVTIQPLGSKVFGGLKSPPRTTNIFSSKSAQKQMKGISFKENMHLDQVYASSPHVKTHNKLRERLQKSAHKRQVFRKDNLSALERARDEARKRRQYHLSAVKRNPAAERRANELKQKTLFNLVKNQVDVAQDLIKTGKYEDAREFMKTLRQEVKGTENLSIFWVTCAQIEEANGTLGQALDLLTEAEALEENTAEFYDIVRKEKERLTSLLSSEIESSYAGVAEDSTEDFLCSRLESTKLSPTNGPRKLTFDEVTPGSPESPTESTHELDAVENYTNDENDVEENLHMQTAVDTYSEDENTPTRENAQKESQKPNIVDTYSEDENTPTRENAQKESQKPNMMGSAQRIMFKGTRSKDKNVMALFSATKLHQAKASRQVTEGAGSIRSLDVVRSSVAVKHEFGSELAATPVRRSARNSAKKEKKTRSEILEEVNYTYQPNPMLAGWRED